MTRPADCDALRELLHERLDGTLDDSRSERLERHLEICFDCRVEAAELEALRAATARLPREIEPIGDLWAGVERRLEPPRERRGVPAPRFGADRWRPAPALVAAAAALALAIGVWLWRAQPEPSAATTAAATSADAEAAASRNQTRAELARFEDGMLLAHQDLLAAVQSQPDRFSPETLAAIEENVRIIDQAIGQIRAALEEDPLNPRLHLLLAARYQHEVQLLKRLSDV